MDLLTRLLKIIENDNAPSISELLPYTNLVHDYYQRLVNIIQAEKDEFPQAHSWWGQVTGNMELAFCGNCGTSAHVTIDDNLRCCICGMD